MNESTIVVATANPGKLAELEAVLKPALDGRRLVAQGTLGVSSPVEDGLTFVENALIKARHAARETGMAAIADDSGLVVPVLGGDPGLRSARYAGERAGDAENNAKLLRSLHEVREQQGIDAFDAFFFCALVCLAHETDPAPVVTFGRWHGHIVETPRGDNGFGYDPHFFVPALGKTAAELEAGEKNRLSHRGQASRALAEALRQP